MPPITRETEVRQLARERAERLIGVLACEKTLKAQPGMARNHFSHLGDRLLRQPARGLERERLRAKAELENDFVSMFFQPGEKQLIHVRRINVPFDFSGLIAP